MEREPNVPDQYLKPVTDPEQRLKNLILAGGQPNELVNEAARAPITVLGEAPLGGTGRIGSAMVLNPRTIGAFQKLMKQGTARASAEYPNLQKSTKEALGFLRARYPSFMKRLDKLGLNVVDKITPEFTESMGLPASYPFKGLFKDNVVAINEGALDLPLLHSTRALRVNTLLHELRHAMQGVHSPGFSPPIPRKYGVSLLDQSRDLRKIQDLRDAHMAGQIGREEYMNELRKTQLEGQAYKAGDLGQQAYELYDKLVRNSALW